MLFVNLCALIDGKLENNPSISSFSNIIFEANKVKIGDLFVGRQDDIPEALKNGAYGIVSTNFKITDNEIAWISVKDLELAKVKFLRYLVLRTSKNIIFLDKVELDIFKSICEEKSILYLEKNIEFAIKLLFLKKEVQNIIFSDKSLFEKLDLENLSISTSNTVSIIKYTLFLTSFIYQNTLYKDIKLPKIFIQKLERVLNICDKYELKYMINKLHFINHFKPIFLDSYFKVLSFGQSTKVIILESDEELLLKEIEYIKQNAPWAKVVLVLPNEFKNKVKTKIDIVYHKNFSELKDKNIFYYNFAIMLDYDEGFENYIENSSTKVRDTLF